MIEIKSFREFKKNSLIGFATVFLSSVGLEIRDCTVHTKDGKRWIALPAKPYTKDDGTQGYTYIVAFPDKKMWEGFQKQAGAALDKFLQTQKGGEVDDKAIPF